METDAGLLALNFEALGDIGMITLLQPSHEKHRQRVAGWLAADHVTRWWGDATERLRQFDETPDDHHAMIAKDGEAIGYVRWEVVDVEALRAVGLDGIPEGAIDVDLFIGNPDLTGRGIGPQALQQLFDRLQETTDAPLAGFCTSVENAPAQAAFEKAGCELMVRYDDPAFGPCHVYARWLR